MEKISIRSAYSEVSLYARWSATAPGKPKAGDAGSPAGPANPALPDDGAAARSSDGDTFTLSLEARAIQVSETITIETAGVAGKPGGATESARPGRLEALMEALGRKRGHGDRRCRYPGLADAADVAARAAEDWDREFAGHKGSRRDFAAGIRAGLDRWAAGGEAARPRAQEYRAFRSEVAVEISARLEIWTAASGPEGQAAPGPTIG
jgi:hypothetical protein